jgi:N-acetylglucosamine malate deacetylase 2
VQELEQAKRVVIVVAHPDDEVIGAGALLPYLRDVRIVHTTDGSPLDLSDAARNGFASREEYAAARQQELTCALELAGIPRDHMICLGFTDKETMNHLWDLCRRVEEELLRLDPDAVLTQPYEGGHPDHDSTAFAVHRCFGRSGRLFEMTSYHAKDGALETSVFLPRGECAAVRALREEDADRKRRMLACFKSQESVLRDFPVVPEQFRRAPHYDFTQPPHPGMLHYERLPWGITGHRWRELAARCE